MAATRQSGVDELCESRELPSCRPVNADLRGRRPSPAPAPGRARAQRARGWSAVTWLIALAVVGILGGCGRHAVRASEKEHLADRVMQFDEDGGEAEAEEHVLSNREGAAGGRGTKGGGCGCN